MIAEYANGTSESIDTRAVGVLGDGDLATEVIGRLAGNGRRVLHHIPGHPVPTRPGVEHAVTLADLAYDSRIILNFTASTDALLALLVGCEDRGGLGAEMQPGAILIDFAIRMPRESNGLLGLLGTRGIAVVDAALISTPTNASSRDVTSPDAQIVVGGFPDAVADVHGILADIGAVTVTGRLGSAHTLAALHAASVASQHALRFDINRIAASAGIDDTTQANFGLAFAAAAPQPMSADQRQRLDVARRLAAGHDGIAPELAAICERVAAATEVSG